MMGRSYAAAAVLFTGALVSRNAEAENKYLCCALSGQGACVAQSAPCAVGAGVALSDLPDNAGSPRSARVTQASFPSGVDGYVSWSVSTPRVGLCLVAPSGADPMHTAPAEPVGCIQLSLAPGIGAAMANYVFPVDSRWDAYEFCYGRQLNSSNAAQYTEDGKVATCANVNDLLDPTVSPTPLSGSCCAPTQLLRPGDHPAGNAGVWSVGIGQEIPGVPPNELIFSADGGLHAYPEFDAGDYLGDVPSACLAAYNEPENCGTPPASQGVGFSESALTTDGGAPCVTCDEPPSSVPTGDGHSSGCSVGDGPGAAARIGFTALLVLGIAAAIRRLVSQRTDAAAR
jgi:MYXO-CTERM domain-containing protein